MLKKIGIFLTKGIMKLVGFAAVLGIIYVVTRFAFHYTYNIAMQPAPENRVVKEISVEIPKGSSTKKIADILEDKGLISSAFMFRFKSRLEGYDGSFKQGTFSLNTSMDDYQIMDILRSGGTLRAGIEFMIPEGYTLEQIAQKLGSQELVKANEFIQVSEDADFGYPFIKEIPERNLRLQGYLFPDTYEVREGATSKEIISKMLSRFDQIVLPEYYVRAEELGMTMDQIITIASIVEREARKEDERKKIAGVIYNRLKANMKLEMCSTVLYAIKEPGKVTVTEQDTEVNSPYNTYKYEGLPPGPIANPGKASIEAALYPEDHDYYFFVVDPNKSDGSHIFSKTYGEHLRAQQK